MSNFLAFATVTAALRELLREAAEADVPGASVAVGRPEEPNGAGAVPKVTIFLYQVTPNAALRNADLPMRAPNGTLVQRPRAALDLHYLLTFQGNDVELEPERLLGSVVRALHARPVLTPPVIQRVTQAGTILAGSNLTEGPELVKFTPLPLTLEELSKLWSVLFQTPYSLSIAYQASVVLIDGEEAPEPAPPVREPVVSVEPFEAPP
jgi:hypothetical protein